MEKHSDLKVKRVSSIPNEFSMFHNFFLSTHLLIQSQVLFDTVVRNQTTLNFFKDHLWTMNAHFLKQSNFKIW